MKKILLALAITPLFVLIAAFKPTSTIVQFESANWESSKSRAIAEGKLYFVDFDASYCATCRNMDESTYMSERLANYISKNVVAVRVDVQDFDGVMWSQQYEVEALPTMLIFNEQGELVKRLVGYKNADDLLEEFSQLRTVKPAPVPPVNTAPKPAPIAADKPMSKTNSPTNPTQIGTITTNNYPNQAEKPVSSGLGLYEVAVRKQESRGYGVQVGVFSTYETVLAQASTFKRKYSKKTLIHIDEYNGSIVYKLVLGAFNSKRDAAYFRNDLRRDNIDGLVKDLSLMK
ncbi:MULTISPECIES: thioredoxin domain-containing protein [unclassified Aureispira]|uniref:thioredoxin domain-containing protein n=1 Tax=unclassified Aureispira TaxID=2649989 RepID=UPI000695AB0F|nr:MULTISPECIES: thioredoxin domain-containing protein [unclassified Aureispira]WMX15174.1 thioredoxin domain-containing protein [Aureispira sp. CCB-E]